jgi:hypothetical protein
MHQLLVSRTESQALINPQITHKERFHEGNFVYSAVGWRKLATSRSRDSYGGTIAMGNEGVSRVAFTKMRIGHWTNCPLDQLSIGQGAYPTSPADSTRGRICLCCQDLFRGCKVARRMWCFCFNLTFCRPWIRSPVQSPED